MSKVPLTARGVEQLRIELRQKKTVERRSITKAIEEARSHGDLKENAEYHAAKDQQGLLEARIKDIEHVLDNVQVIDVTQVNAEGRVVFGATVRLQNTETEAEIRYQIVGAEEADIKAGLISITSPIARALIGREAGDVVDVEAPGGVTSYAVVEVEYI